MIAPVGLLIVEVADERNVCAELLKDGAKAQLRLIIITESKIVLIFILVFVDSINPNIKCRGLCLNYLRKVQVEPFPLSRFEGEIDAS